MTSDTIHTPAVAEPALKYESGYRYLNLYTSPRLFSEEEYLQLEREAESKSEYVDGAIYAMSGGSFTHAALISHIGELFLLKRRDKNCGIYFSDLRLHIQGYRSYFYPDVIMICGKPTFRDERSDTVTNPTLLVEVLSPSTQKVDTQLKAERYLLIPSLRWYIMVHQDEMRVVMYSRNTNDGWQQDELTQGDDALTMDMLKEQITLKELYEDIFS